MEFYDLFGLSRQELDNLLKSRLLALDLLRIYEAEMVKVKGRQAYQELLDDVLDDINLIHSFIKNFLEP